MRALIVSLFVFMASGILLAVALTNTQDVSREEFEKHSEAIKLLARAVDDLQQKEVIQSGKEGLRRQR